MAGAEFPAASSMFDDPGRRQFLKLMGASLLLGGLAACNDQTRSDQALPYVNQPDQIVPGVPRYYATAVLFEGYAQPVLATTYAGRPTKLDGNPDHPVTRGASDPFMQSAIFGLYDPERSKAPLRDSVPSTWGAFSAELVSLRTRWRERQGEGLRILTGATTSPTLIRQMSELAKQYPKMRWHRFEPVGAASQDAAMTLAFGRAATPHLRLDRCDVIVSLGHDLLGPGPNQVLHAAAWAQQRGDRAPGQGRARLHVAECVPSLTGTVSSTRLPCDASRLGVLAQAIGTLLSVAGLVMPDLSSQEKKWVDRAADELRAHQGRSLLAIGSQLDPRWQALAASINGQLNNSGATVWYSEPIASTSDKAQTLTALASDMAGGSVDTLLTIDCNPAYASAGSLDFVKHLQRVPQRLHAGLHVDETARLCQWHLPLSHPLESFGDALAVDGSALIMQPVVAPLYSSRSVHQIAEMLLGAADPSVDGAIHVTWQTAFGS